jgi:glycosyltransferase involved in cell wall biosynthesis
VKSSVVIVMNALHSGGAEKTCLELVRALGDRCRFVVVALLGGGPAETELRAAGAEVVLLEAGGPLRMWRAAWRLARLMRATRPTAVITFLYIADLVGGLFARLFAPGSRVYWNVRNNVLSRTQTGTASFMAARIAARVSRRLPHAVVYCSQTARRQHEQLGYQPRAAAVVENDSTAVRFQFNEQARHRMRARIGAAVGESVFLFVGRFDPVKRVDLFLDACDELLAGGVPARFALAGRGMDDGNDWLRSRIAATRDQRRFVLCGYVSDQQALYSGADCLVMTSESEGSPNVLYEAQATQLPAIVLATLGTEHIEGPGVNRLASRDPQLLSAAMLGFTHTARAARAALRESAQSEHALAAHFRTLLPCA